MYIFYFSCIQSDKAKNMAKKSQNIEAIIEVTHGLKYDTIVMSHELACEDFVIKSQVKILADHIHSQYE
jgi:hypothetical protein